MTTPSRPALVALGWDETYEAAYGSWANRVDRRPGRVSLAFNQNFRVVTDDGEVDAVAAGRLKHRAENQAALPAVGDWVVVRQVAAGAQAVITDLLPRRSTLSRRGAGLAAAEQVVAANVDILFIVMGLDRDYSLRRLERYLLMAREGGVSPVIVLTKPDLAPDVETQVRDVTSLVDPLPVIVVRPPTGEGVDRIRTCLEAGRTGALVGSSGVGKTTIINQLTGASPRATQAVRASDSRGRHTTIHRELVVLPGGGLLIDTPGMREVQVWAEDVSVRESFDDITRLAAGCHFTDCRHREEPRCAVKAAIEGGTLDADRLTSYLALREELSTLAQQKDERTRRVRPGPPRRASRRFT